MIPLATRQTRCYGLGALAGVELLEPSAINVQAGTNSGHSDLDQFRNSSSRLAGPDDLLTSFLCPSYRGQETTKAILLSLVEAISPS
jgi:hypothetical protein